jgi:hypothetical protein
MDQLPQELIDRISGYLSPNDLKNTLLLSHSFRFSAEKYSGAFSAFELHEGNVQRFIDTYHGHRLLYLRSVEFWIRLPRVESICSSLRDGVEQLNANDKSLSRQIALLLEAFRKIEEHSGNIGKFTLTIYTPKRAIPIEHRPLSFQQHLSWRVRLLEPETLPSIGSIRSLDIQQAMVRPGEVIDTGYVLEPVKLDYGVMVDLLAKLPNLEYWGCRIGGDEWEPEWPQEWKNHYTRDWAGPRRDTRKDFAKALLQHTGMPQSLRRVRLDFLHDLLFSERINHHAQQPDLVNPAINDHLSLSLHHLSQSLRRVHIRAVVDESLFWPKNDAITIPNWPHLETLVVMFHMVSPSGKYYFTGLNNEGASTLGYSVTDTSYPPLETTDYDERMLQDMSDEGAQLSETRNCHFRIVPNDEVIQPFLEALAKAATTVGKLKEAALWCPLSWDDQHEHDSDGAVTEWISKDNYNMDMLAWGVYYLAAGEKHRDYREPDLVPSDANQLWWRVAKWRPSSELHELFRRIGSSSGSGRLEEHWNDAEYGEKMVNRDYFEEFIHDDVEEPGKIPEPR